MKSISTVILILSVALSQSARALNGQLAVKQNWVNEPSDNCKALIAAAISESMNKDVSVADLAPVNGLWNYVNVGEEYFDIRASRESDGNCANVHAVRNDG